MLSLKELQQVVSKYLDGGGSFDDFAVDYQRVSRGKFGADAEVLQACLKIDAALSMVYFDAATEVELREELANVVRPFARSADSEVRYDPIVLSPAVQRIQPRRLAVAAGVAIVVLSFAAGGPSEQTTSASSSVPVAPLLLVVE